MAAPPSTAPPDYLFLTELIGMKVFDLKGQRIGSVRDAALVPTIHPMRVDRFLVGGGWAWMTVRHDQVRSIGLDGIHLRAEQLTPYHDDEYMLRIVQDLLDQQIIDAQGRKVVRVTDVSFTVAREDEHDVLLVHRRRHRDPQRPAARPAGPRALALGALAAKRRFRRSRSRGSTATSSSRTRSDVCGSTSRRTGSRTSIPPTSRTSSRIWRPTTAGPSSSPSTARSPPRRSPRSNRASRHRSLRPWRPRRRRRSSRRWLRTRPPTAGGGQGGDLRGDTRGNEPRAQD